MEGSENGKLRGGIDLGGTKIEAIVVDAEQHVRGQARQPTPTEGGPADVAKQMIEALKDAAKAAGVSSATSPGWASARPGTSTRRPARWPTRATCPAGRSRSRWARRCPMRFGTPVKIGNDVQVATDAEFSLGAGKPYDSVLGVFWGTGVGGGLILDGKPWLGRGGAGEIGHMVVRRNGAHCPCGRRGCMEAYAGRLAMELRARREADKGARTDLFKIMKSRGRTRLTSSVWAHALDDGDPAGHRAHRAGGQSPGGGHRLGGQPARHRGRDHRRRPRGALRTADGRADRH